MPAPSKLAIATSSVQRLVKEEASYHTELTQQEARIAKLTVAEADDENAEYQLKQERAALEETKAVFPMLHTRIADAVAKLEDLLQRDGGAAPEAEVKNAEAALEMGKKVGK